MHMRANKESPGTCQIEIQKLMLTGGDILWWRVILSKQVGFKLTSTGHGGRVVILSPPTFLGHIEVRETDLQE